MDLKAALQDNKPKQEIKPTVVIREPMDLERAKQALSIFDDPLKDLLALAEKVDIRTEEDYQAAGEIYIKTKKFSKAIEKKAKDLIPEDADAYIKGIHALKRAMLGKVDPIEKILKPKMGRGRAFLDAEAAKKKKAMEEEQARVQEELNKQYEGTGVEAPVLPPVAPLQDATEKVVRSEQGTLHTRKEWKLTEITDPTEVPRQYCSPDASKIRDAIKAGIYNIPGCRIEEVHTPITR